MSASLPRKRGATICEPSTLRPAQVLLSSCLEAFRPYPNVSATAGTSRWQAASRVGPPLPHFFPLSSHSDDGSWFPSTPQLGSSVIVADRKTQHLVVARKIVHLGWRNQLVRWRCTPDSCALKVPSLRCGPLLAVGLWCVRLHPVFRS